MSSYFAYLTNLPFYECTITATAKGCYPEMYHVRLEKLSLLNDSDDYIIDNTANQMNCVG